MAVHAWEQHNNTAGTLHRLLDNKSVPPTVDPDLSYGRTQYTSTPGFELRPNLNFHQTGVKLPLCYECVIPSDKEDLHIMRLKSHAVLESEAELRGRKDSKGTREGDLDFKWDWDDAQLGDFMTPCADAAIQTICHVLEKKKHGKERWHESMATSSMQK
ncbi:MAG: hypothetical protein Q9186_006008 [Xanthomendoza sp. 1 TL-2023]